METLLIEGEKSVVKDQGQKAFSKSFYLSLHPIYFPNDLP